MPLLRETNMFNIWLAGVPWSKSVLRPITAQFSYCCPLRVFVVVVRLLNARFHARRSEHRGACLWRMTDVNYVKRSSQRLGADQDSCQFDGLPTTRANTV